MCSQVGGKQARGQAKSWWGQLTDDELDKIEGESEKLLGVLQSRYGWSREQAEQEIERRMGEPLELLATRVMRLARRRSRRRRKPPRAPGLVGARA